MNDILYCCRMRDESGSFEAAAELLNALEVDFSTWENREEKWTVHTVYAETPEAGQANLELLRTAVTQWRECGIELGEPEYFELRKEEWADAWKKYFPVLQLSERLVIKPGWLDYDPTPGQVVVEIDPGMSFGTGQHATTNFCLRMIDRYAGTPGVSSLLDAGCGSGILAIAAVKLGYTPVDAFDYDPEAVRMAAENFNLNAISPEVLTPTADDAAVYRGREGGYDFVAANILGHLLSAYRLNIASWVRPGGFLALAGILNEEFDALSAQFVQLGFREIERDTCREWTGGLFQKEL